MSLVITEIMGRSEQGTTRPFLCRGDDGHAYFVKGRFAGGRSLCCEWLAGRLAQLAGLPVTEARIAEVPLDLIRFSSRRDARELGEGRVFASRVIDGARELTWKDVNLVPIDTRRRVLWFDGWVQNADRTLSSYGGNPNLMVSLDGERIWAFDFNLAFDEAFDTQQFWATHALVGAATDNLPDAFLAQAAEWMREGRGDWTIFGVSFRLNGCFRMATYATMHPWIGAWWSGSWAGLKGMQVD